MTLAERFRDVTALVLGDVMLDEYVWGEVQRISPEAPVPVVEIKRRTHTPGGAANAAAGIAALGAGAFLVGVIGEDGWAETLRKALASTGVTPEHLVEDPNRETTVKTRVIAHAQQVVRADAESRADLPAASAAALIETIDELIGRCDVLVVSDYDKGVVSTEVANAAITAADLHGVPIVVDSKGGDYSKFTRATVLTPNAHDASRAAGMRIESDADLLTAATRIRESCAGAALLITRGAAGMSLFWEGEPLHIPTEAREVYDVTGAGDTVVAILGAALGADVPLPEAVALANAGAGIVVGKVGTSTVDADELEAWVADTDGSAD